MFLHEFRLFKASGRAFCLRSLIERVLPAWAVVHQPLEFSFIKTLHQFYDPKHSRSVSANINDQTWCFSRVLRARAERKTRDWPVGTKKKVIPLNDYKIGSLFRTFYWLEWKRYRVNHKLIKLTPRFEANSLVSTASKTIWKMKIALQIPVP